MAVTTRGDHRLATLSPVSAPAPIAAIPQLGGLSSNELYAGWYSGDPQQRLSDPARSAYESALDILKSTLTAEEYQTPWLRQQSSMQDVREAVVQALEGYKAKSNGSKAQEWLLSFSERVVYYGSIFDTLAQHHPEYVALAWGAIKFLFISVLNHEELLKEICKAISDLADVLPRTELHSILYPTARMQEAVALLYAKIMEFVVKAIKWCKKGKVSHAIASITHPFELKFKPIINDITRLSRVVDKLANAALKAEIRDLHFTVHQMHRSITHLTDMMAYQQQQQTLHNQSLLSLRAEQQVMFRRGQVEEIRNTILLLDDTPDPSESLEFCRSMRRRRRQTMPTQLPAVTLAKLNAWVAQPSSSMVLAQGKGIRTSSLDFAIDFMDAVLDRNYPIIWALPGDSDSGRPTPSVTGILRSLISQLLELESGQAQRGTTNAIPLKHFKAKSDLKNWFQILEGCIAVFPRLFVVIDTSLVEGRDEGYFMLSEFIDAISDIVTRRSNAWLKVVVISWRFETTTSVDPSEVFTEAQFTTDMGRRVQRMMRQPKYRAIFKRRVWENSKRFQFPVDKVV